MNTIFKRVLAGVSAIAMLSSVSMVSAFADDTATTTSDVLLNYYDKPLIEDGIHGDTNLDDMVYVHYTMSDIQDTIDSIEDLADADYNQQNLNTFFELYYGAYTFDTKIYTSNSLAYLYYSLNPTTENISEYTDSTNLCVEFYNAYSNAMNTVMSGSFGSSLLEELYDLATSDGEDADSYAEMYQSFASFLEDDAINEEVQELYLEISNKQSLYFSLVQTDISSEIVTYDGQSMTYSQLMNKYISLYYELTGNYSSYEDIPESKLNEYYAIESAIDSAKKSYGIDNETLGQLYIDIVNLYNSLAVAQGCDNYIDMAFSYDIDEIEQMSSDVQEYITPIVSKYSKQLQNVEDYQSILNETYSVDEAKELAYTVVSAVDDEYLDIYNYMTDHNLLVLDDDYTYAQGYTATLPEYSEGYIYLAFMDDFYSWFTNGIAHEFGHFIDWYTNLDGMAYTQNSVAENVSVSFSYICNENLDAYFNDTDKSNILCVSNVLENTLNYVNSCLSTSDLELYAFQNADTVTPSDLLEMENSLTYEYGLMGDISYQLGGLKEYSSFVSVNQIYTQPFYTTDYAMSGLTALNVLYEYVSDNDSGLELFDTLYNNDYYYDDYVTMMSEGLGIDIYADDYVTNIAQNLDSYLKSKMAEIYGGELGDVNLDGSIDSVDLLTFKKYLLGMEVSEDDFNTTTADLNSDGEINAVDLLKLKRIILQMD